MAKQNETRKPNAEPARVLPFPEQDVFTRGIREASTPEQLRFTRVMKASSIVLWLSDAGVAAVLALGEAEGIKFPRYNPASR